MNELLDLQELAKELVEEYQTLYTGDEIELPIEFKNKVNQIDNNPIVYQQYSAIVSTRGGQRGALNIYLPNQWFYIASFFTRYYKELQKYKSLSLEVLSSDRLNKLKGKSLTLDEENKLAQKYGENTKDLLKKFVTDYDWWGGGKTIDRGDFFVSPILNYAKLVNVSQSYVADLCAFLARNEDLVGLLYNAINQYNNHHHSTTSKNASSFILNLPLQQIFYGAPGTGKSHEVKKQTGELLDSGEERDLPNVFRTTFHPDTDYASFVGCYKPTMRTVADKYKAVAGKDEEIVYEFVPQAFTDAYVYAYNNPEEPTYLVIEEINRGNCAQIFGDLFQLLDRKGGVSEYKIKADKDLANYLIGILGEGSEGIKDGKLCLPANLSILATMNTSDQSLFPMDSAFKRRWEWEYVPINYGTDVKSGTFEIKIGEKAYPWVDFIKEANKRIFDLTQSEDKQLGNFFIKHSVDEKEFKSKVMFYLWYEVLRDETENNKYFFYKQTTIDGKDERSKFIFKDLYEEDATQTLQQFMDYLGVPSK